MSNYLTLADAKIKIDRIDAVYVDADLQSDIDTIEFRIDAALTHRYIVPVTNATAITYLQGLVIQILRMKAFAHFADSEDLPNAIVLEYKDAIKIISDLSRNNIQLPGAEESSTKRPGSLVVNLDTDTDKLNIDYY